MSGRIVEYHAIVARGLRGRRTENQGACARHRSGINFHRARPLTQSFS
jgi:hypothetical protein